MIARPGVAFCADWRASPASLEITTDTARPGIDSAGAGEVRAAILPISPARGNELIDV